MAGNTVLNAGAGGDTIATDDVAGIKYQYVKLTDGTADSAEPIPGSTANGLLVNLGANNDVVVSNIVDVTGSIVAVGSSVLPTGAATAALQLPDGHNVTIDNAAGAAAVNIQDGGNSITVDGSLTTVATVTNLAQMAGAAIAMGTGVRSAGTQRVTIATDDVVPVTNAALAVVGNGAAATAQRVTMASDSTGILAAVTSLTQMNGQAIAMGTGVRSAGTQRVTVATDDAVPLAAETTKVIGTVRLLGNAGAILDGATGTAVPPNAMLTGVRVATSNPTNEANGDSVAAMADKAGRQVVTTGNVRELISVQTTTITNSSAETTVVTAGGANVFRDLSSIAITNRSGTAVSCTLKDATAGTTRAIYSIAANGGIVVPFPIPMPQAAANGNWTITLSVNTVTVDINTVYVNNL